MENLKALTTLLAVCVMCVGTARAQDQNLGNTPAQQESVSPPTMSDVQAQQFTDEEEDLLFQQNQQQLLDEEAASQSERQNQQQLAMSEQPPEATQESITVIIVED
jgi:hypothetical protein